MVSAAQTCPWNYSSIHSGTRDTLGPQIQAALIYGLRPAENKCGNYVVRHGDSALSDMVVSYRKLETESLLVQCILLEYLMLILLLCKN